MTLPPFSKTHVWGSASTGAFITAILKKQYHGSTHARAHARPRLRLWRRSDTMRYAAHRLSGWFVATSFSEHVTARADKLSSSR